MSLSGWTRMGGDEASDCWDSSLIHCGQAIGGCGGQADSVATRGRKITRVQAGDPVSPSAKHHCSDLFDIDRPRSRTLTPSPTAGDAEKLGNETNLIDLTANTKRTPK